MKESVDLQLEELPGQYLLLELVKGGSVTEAAVLCKLTLGGAPDSTGNMAIFGLRVEFPLVSNGTL
jgi:hypothetical protein